MDLISSISRIRHCKDYYEILQVTKEVTDVQLKKKYRELALKLHPVSSRKQSGSIPRFRISVKLLVRRRPSKVSLVNIITSVTSYVNRF